MSRPLRQIGASASFGRRGRTPAPVTAELANKLLSYDPRTGLLRWRETRGNRPAGAVAGARHSSGHIHVCIGKKFYQAHRLAWLLVYGQWPIEQIDHVNGVRDDNRLVNLRLATHAENCRNCKTPSHNTSGVKGVHWHERSQKWRAKIKVNGRAIYLGLFESKLDAARAYAAAAKAMHGAFARPETLVGEVTP